MIWTVNLEIKDPLTNGQTENISHTKLAGSSFWKVYVKFSDGKSGLKAIR